MKLNGINIVACEYVIDTEWKTAWWQRVLNKLPFVWFRGKPIYSPKAYYLGLENVLYVSYQIYSKLMTGDEKLKQAILGKMEK